MPHTPQELVDHILNFAREDLPTLRSSRLVCRSWNISARVHTCRRLDLQVREQDVLNGLHNFNGGTLPCAHLNDVSSTVITEQTVANTDLFPSPTSGSHKSGQHKALLTRLTFKRLQSLFDILQCSLDMAHCVREVVVGNTIHLEQSEQWKAYAELLTNILSSLPRVSSLYLQHMYFPSPAFAKFLLEALPSAVELERLELLDCLMPQVDDILPLLNHFPGMTSLRLSNVRFKEFQGYNHNGLPASNCQNTPLHYERQFRRSLLKLSIDALPLSPILCCFISRHCRIDLTKLRSLTLSNVSDIPNLRCFLQVAGGNLEDLQITGPCYSSRYVDQQAMFNLSHTPRLKTLRIFGPKWMASICPSEKLQHIFKLSQPAESSKLSSTNYVTSSSAALSPPPPTSLESLHIGIAAFKRDGQDLDYSKWSALDEVLSGPAFASLALVNMEIDMTLSGKRGVDAAKVVASFPRLRKAKKIYVACS